MPKKFPTYPLIQILKKAGAERVSKEAIEELKKIVFELSEKIAKDAVSFAKHAKRKTVRKEDVELAIKL